MKKFRHYLLGVSFKLVTGNIALTQTIKKKHFPREVAEWILYMADFDFKTDHRADERMRHADCLIRYADDGIEKFCSSLSKEMICLLYLK